MALCSKMNRQALRTSSTAARQSFVRASVFVRAQAVPVPTTAPSTSYVPVNGNGNGVAYPPQPITVNVPEAIPGVLAPPQVYQTIVNNGAKKATTDVAKLFISGILAGMYIGVGAFLACAVGGGMSSLTPTLPGVVKLVTGLIFPVGLTLVTLSGAELYTGNTAVVTAAVYEEKATWGGLIKNWFWSYLGNFVGSLLMVAAVAATGILNGNAMPVTLATAKSSLPLATCLARAVICNWLVCMAVWNATSATTLTGKMAGLWGPIATFVAIGLEHSVANMFFIPMGIVLGAKVTWSEFLLNNLLPVTVGNTLGGFIFVGTAFAFLYGRLGKKAEPASAQ